MKRTWPLVALGIGAFLILALTTLPARVVLGRLDTDVVRIAGVQGTLWNGRAEVLQVAGIHLGSVNWKVHILPLFTARLSADVKVTRTDGFAEGRVMLSARAVSLGELSASLPLAMLPSHVNPGAWVGTANARFEELVLRDGWPVTATGSLELHDLTGPSARPANVGSYRVVFPAAAERGADVLAGDVSDLGGPLQITATVQLQADRSYSLEGLVAAKPETPPDVARALQFLGPADAQGRREFSLAGTM